MNTDSILQFYEGLTADYHCVYADWPGAVARQGTALGRLLEANGLPPPARVLDCACGIGTQALGLAGRGYRVHGTDLSPRSVERAASEATEMGVALSVSVADSRNLEDHLDDLFEAVICCDNSLPHMLNDEDIERALTSMRSRLVDDGLLLVSIRDYDSILQDRPSGTRPLCQQNESGRRIVFQVWDWADDKPTYVLRLFLMREAAAGRWHTSEHTTEYRALRRQELSDCLSRAGFSDVSWRLPAETGFYQPVVTARRTPG